MTGRAPALKRPGAAAVEQRLGREVNHRVRNSLAGLLTLVDLFEDDPQLPRILRESVLTMARVHDLLSASGGRPVRLSNLVGAVVGLDAGRLTIEGEDPFVPSRQVPALGAVLRTLLDDDGATPIVLRTRRAGDRRIELTFPAASALGEPKLSRRYASLVRGCLRHELRGRVRAEGDAAVLEIVLDDQHVTEPAH